MSDDCVAIAAKFDDLSRGLRPARILAEGRDPSATLDSGFPGTEGFQNEGDNEITGWHTPNGDPSAAGILRAAVPKLFSGGWRTFSRSSMATT